MKVTADILEQRNGGACYFFLWKLTELGKDFAEDKFWDSVKYKIQPPLEADGVRRLVNRGLRSRLKLDDGQWTILMETSPNSCYQVALGKEFWI